MPAVTREGGRKALEAGESAAAPAAPPVPSNQDAASLKATAAEHFRAGRYEEAIQWYGQSSQVQV